MMTQLVPPLPPPPPVPVLLFPELAVLLLVDPDLTLTRLPRL